MSIHGSRKLSESEVAPTTPSRSRVSFLGVLSLASYCIKRFGSVALQGQLEGASQTILKSQQAMLGVGWEWSQQGLASSGHELMRSLSKVK